MRTTACLFAVLVALIAGAAWPQTVEPRIARDREFTEGAWLEPNLNNGGELYQTCEACHGADGRGTEDGEIPAIAGQHGSVLLKQLTDFRHDQRWDERMRNFTDRHHLRSSQDLTDVAAYVASLPRFPATAKGMGDGTALGVGASTYFQKCERCHGPLGQGSLLLRRPRLAGQHYGYLLRQLQETAAGKRPGMDRSHVDMLKDVSPAEIRGVADYLSRVSPDLNSIKSR